MAFPDTLAALRRAKGLSQAETAEFLTARGRPVTQRAVSKWERGSTLPDAEQLLLLCELYGVRDALAAFGRAPAEESLNALGRRRLAEYGRLLAASPEFSASAAAQGRLMRSIPLYDLPASAGTGQFLDGDRYELMDADASVPLAATFAVRISGDSMVPRFHDGEVVYVKQQQTLEPGEYGIFLLNGSAYCKRLAEKGRAALESINEKYPPIQIGRYDELRILGKVVGQSGGR